MNYEQILLEQAEAFALHLGERIDLMPARHDDPRTQATTMACQLSIEHAYALRILFATGAQNAASAMLQLQYDALVKAAWCAYVATDAELEAMLDPARSFSLPLPGRMVHGLKAQLAGEPALAGLVKPLLAMNDDFTKALGMLEQSGVHPLQQTGLGFPVDLFDTIVRSSSGLMFLGFRLLARQGPDGEFIRSMDASHAGFEDALPMACFRDPALVG